MAFQKASKGYTPISGKWGESFTWIFYDKENAVLEGLLRAPKKGESSNLHLQSEEKVTIQSRLSVCRRVVWSCSGQLRFLQKQKQQHAQRGSASVEKNSKGELPFQAWLGSEVFTCKPAGPNSKGHIWSIGLVPNLTFIKISKQS